MLRWALATIWTCFAAGMLWSTSGRSWKHTQEHQIILTPPPLSNLDPAFINIISLGHPQLYDDFIVMWMIQLSAHRELTPEQFQQLGSMYQSLGGVYRPKHESFYMLGCFTMALDARHPEYCHPLTEIGLSAFPDSWRIPMMQGYIDGFKIKNYPRAAHYYHMASSRPDSPEYVRKVAIKMLNQEGVSQDEIETMLNSIVSSPGRESFRSFVDEARSHQDNIQQPDNSEGGHISP